MKNEITRMCFVCRNTYNKTQMLRLVKASTAGMVDTEEEDAEKEDSTDVSGMSALPIGLTVFGFGMGGASITPDPQEYKGSKPETVKGQNSYQKMNVLTK